MVRALFSACGEPLLIGATYLESKENIDTYALQSI
jgi:hypothetical protein